MHCLWSVAVLDISALSVDLLRLFSLVRDHGMCMCRSASHCFFSSPIVITCYSTAEFNIYRFAWIKIIREVVMLFWMLFKSQPAISEDPFGSTSSTSLPIIVSADQDLLGSLVTRSPIKDNWLVDSLTHALPYDRVYLYCSSHGWRYQLIQTAVSSDTGRSSAFFISSVACQKARDLKPITICPPVQYYSLYHMYLKMISLRPCIFSNIR